MPGRLKIKNFPKHTCRSFWLFSGLLVIALLFCQGIVSPGYAQTVKKELPGYGVVAYAEGEVLIQFRDDITAGDQARFKQQAARGRSRTAGRQAVLYQSEEGETVEELLDHYRDHPDVRYVQPNFIYSLISPAERFSPADLGLRDHTDSDPYFPDDQFFSAQWALQNEGEPFAQNNSGEVISGTAGADISATRAWNITTGSEDVIIAIFDTGIDYEHPDLVDNLFMDSEGRFGVDCSPEQISEEGACGDDPMDRNGHGTHVAGTIGATGNNGIGISGLNWNVRLMAVRVFNDKDETSTASILAGYDYAIANGAMISNHSYGTTGDSKNFDQIHKNKIAEAGRQGHLMIAAAGNDSSNNDIDPVYPANYQLDNIISVAANEANDELANFSNYGEETVDISAPGHLIFSTFTDEGYEFLSGTSMAAPHVTGVAGLVRAAYPEASIHEIRNRILGNGDYLVSLDGSVREGRRLNAFRSLPTADMQIIHASSDPLAEEVDIFVNGTLLEEGLAYSETSGFLNIPADSDVVISVASGVSGSGEETITEKSLNLARDETFRLILYGSGDAVGAAESGVDLFLDQMAETAVPDNRVSMVLFNGVADYSSVGVYGFFTDDRPPFVITENLDYRSRLDPYELIPNNFDMDVAEGSELLDSFRLMLSGRGGETVVVVVTDAGQTQQPDSRLSVVYSTGEGMGVLAERVTEPGKIARHIPDQFEIEDNFPNPFYPVTQIQFNLPESRDVEVTVYDLLGRRVGTVVNETLQQGIHRVSFDGSGLASGAYIYRVSAGDEILDGKMMLIK